VAVGTHLASLPLVDMELKPASLEWSTSGNGTIVYVFKPNCPWCKLNLESMRTLARLTAHDYRFVGLSLRSDDLPSYVKDNNLPYPVYVAPDTESVKALRISGTPETIVVSRSGIVSAVWTGAYTKRVKSDIENRFKVNLPTFVMSAITP
jgi:hypothetical protein